MIYLALTSLLISTKKVFTSAVGWLLALGGSIFSFFAPEKYTFILVFTAVMFDAFFGTLASLKQGKFLLSKFGRVTLFKEAAYMLILMIIFMMEKLVHDTGFIGVKVAAGWATACEVISMSASICIVWPETIFFRLLRVHLKGEIEAKLGKDITNITGRMEPEKPPIDPLSLGD